MDYINTSGHEPSPDQPSSRSETLLPSAAHRALATAVGYIEQASGLARAIGNVRRYIELAANAYPAPQYRTWLDLISEWHTRLLTAARSDTALLARGAVSHQPYASFLKPIASSLSSDATRGIEAEMGRVAVAYASASTKCPVVLVEGFARVLHAGARITRTTAEWDQIAQDFPRTRPAVEEWMGKARHPQVKKFLEYLCASHDMRVRSPDDLSAPSSNPAIADRDTAQRRTSDGTAEPFHFVVAKVTDAKSASKVEASFLGWKFEAARRAGYRNRFGVEGQWDRQTPGELIHVCQAIYKDLVPDGEFSDCAYFGQICLVASLPSSVTIRLPIGRTSDLFLEEDLKATGWFIHRLLARDRRKTFDLSEAPERSIVLVPQSEAAWKVGLAFRQRHPGATSVCELLLGTTDKRVVKRFFRKYQEWLGRIGKGWLHGVRDARLAKSLPQIYRSQAGDVIAALLGLDLREVGMGTLHYVALPSAFLEQQVALAYERVGWGKPVALNRSVDFVGSAHALPMHEFLARLSDLKAAGDEARRRMETTTDARSLIRHYRRLVHVRQLQVIALAAGRGTRLNRLTWYALYGCADYIMLGDKFTDKYSQERLVPVFSPLREALDAYVDDIDAFVARAQALRLVVRWNGRSFDERQAGRPAFVAGRLKRCGQRLRVSHQPTKRRYLVALAKRFLGRPLNVGRHTVLSAAVLEGLDSWLLKALSGHSHGFAEPFADGGALAPRQALDLLRCALEWMCQGEDPTRRATGTKPRYVLPLAQLRGQPSNREVVSQARVLPPFCDTQTILALRVVEHIASLLHAGKGPNHAGAELQLCATVYDWIPLSDLRHLWAGDSFRAVEGNVPVATWRRNEDGPEIIRPLQPATAFALLRARLATKGSLPSWNEASRRSSAWLRKNVPGVAWPESSEEVLAAFGALMERWMRIEVPPFILTAASSRLAAATANRSSVLRLAADPPAEVDQNTLSAPAPAPLTTPTRRSPTGPSPLSRLMTLIHHYGRTDLPLGEEKQRWKDLLGEASAIDCANDSRARAVKQWIEHEAGLWRPGSATTERSSLHSTGTRLIQVSTAGDYVSAFSSALYCTPPFESMERWHEEWFDFFDILANTAKAKSDKKRRQVVEDRFTATRRFLRALIRSGYSIPNSLLQPSASIEVDNTRRAAASTLVLRANRTRIAALLAIRFADRPLLDELAPLYAELRFRAAFRSTECHVLPLNAVTPFGDVAICTGGWSHLKSEHAKRLGPLPTDTARRFRATAALVAASEPEAVCIFLPAGKDDWSVISEVARDFKEHLRRETGEFDARAHAARAVAPLDQLLGGWEPVLRALLNGSLSVDQAVDYCRQVQGEGVARLIQVIVRTGHGHPLTYLTYYFPLWPLLLSVWARASLARLGGPQSLVQRTMPDVWEDLNAAIEEAQGPVSPFDPWAWTLGRVGSLLDLEPLALESAPCGNPPEASTSASPRTPDQASEILYLATRLANLPPKQATYDFGLSNTASADLELLLESDVGKEMRLRCDLPNTDGGTDALILALNEPEAKVIAERLRAASELQLEQCSAALGLAATPATEPIATNVLAQQLQALSSILPARFALLVQAKAAYYPPEALAGLSRLVPRVQLRKEVKGLGLLPRVSVVDAENHANRVRHGRFTAYVRFVVAATQLHSCRPTKRV